MTSKAIVRTFLTLVACAAALPGLADDSAISEVVTTANERFVHVVVTKLESDRVSFAHDDGVATLPLKDFDDANLDRLIPGYIAKKKQEAAAVAVALERRAHEELEADLQRRKQQIEAEKVAQRESERPKTEAGPIYITQDRAEKYLGPAAQDEMRQFLRQQGQANPSQKDIDFALKLNERLEYHTERAKRHPELYR